MDGNIEHVHGLGYTEERDELFIATHSGLLKYSKGRWYETTTNKHDYMGFQTTDDGFYSSGHPYTESDLKNPFGLIRSKDNGETLEKLAFYGESDFHHLAVGFYSHTVYAINEVPNSKLYTGIFFSENNGETWETSKLNGLTSKSVSKIATHPKKAELVGISTEKGLFYSTDFGDNFQQIGNIEMVTTLYFEEETLLFSSIEDSGPRLYELDLSTRKQRKIRLPEINNNDAIIEITSNPLNRSELVLITQKNDIFLTKDRGYKWQQIVSNGRIGL
ncbi:hypothetical protein LIS77_25045 (plasmid) [Cytobacillus firmus]|uniref:Sortilin N-terminal domain-containing protein n=1 Tax=Cytobacillus firmus TaxID=1399 RepID=A0AA46SM43_CYTFI|nr:hypothetical protein [Cytobacillus firmus]USK41757.1 hypothetical protein LIS77_25045 [Cytobacillus firmus]UYG98015.1 hypothetical protein OD459_26365 [Cytobacillus firmus]